ncbi:MAG TPA: N-acyl homoserine lactonase family protein [Microbacteriaceae bacterium]|nr:N-acyl homoserine lactonase family protein [Microbacteriaceae bacterium]
MALIQVTYADRRVRTSHVWHDFASLGIPDEVIRMPYSLWVLQTPDGPVLIDTGFHTPDSYWVDDADWRPVPEALAAVGVVPAEVRAVLLTHYHFDHVGHVGLFPNATVIASRVEHEHWVAVARESEESLRTAFVWPQHLAAIREAERDGRLLLVDGDSDSPIDGIRLILSPGHTPGQLAVLVESPSGPRLLASDAAHFFEQIELGWHFFAHADAQQGDRSIERLRRIAAEAGAELIPGHDARVRERYPALPGPASDYATLLG